MGSVEWYKKEYHREVWTGWVENGQGLSIRILDCIFRELLKM